jgi:hypothetical protein
MDTKTALSLVRAMPEVVPVRRMLYQDILLRVVVVFQLLRNRTAAML